MPSLSGARVALAVVETPELPPFVACDESGDAGGVLLVTIADPDALESLGVSADADPAGLSDGVVSFGSSPAFEPVVVPGLLAPLGLGVPDVLTPLGLGVPDVALLVEPLDVLDSSGVSAVAEPTTLSVVVEGCQAKQA